MKKGLTALYRRIDTEVDKSRPAGIGNNGGGTTTKIYHMQRALPNLEIINDIEESGMVSIAEILWFHGEGVENLQRNVDNWSKLNAFKILMTSDVELFRLDGALREQIIDGSDVIACLTDYVLQLFQHFTPKAQVLYDPIDIDMFKPRVSDPDSRGCSPIASGQAERHKSRLGKDREIYSAGQITLEKNVQMIAEIFDAIPAEANLTKTYIGGRNLWAGNNRPEASAKLEADLSQVCNHLESEIPYTAIPERIGGIWGYVADTRYDFSSYSMTEAMACGCWIFTGRHLLYDERPGKRFNTSEEAVQHIMAQLQETPPESGVINEEARQFVVDQNSYDAFREQFKNIVGGVGLGL